MVAKRGGNQKWVCRTARRERSFGAEFFCFIGLNKGVAVGGKQDEGKRWFGITAKGGEWRGNSRLVRRRPSPSTAAPKNTSALRTATLPTVRVVKDR